MTVYWLSFRLGNETTSKGSYADRYDALKLALGMASGEGWEEVTSFVVFESALSIDDVGQVAKGAIDPNVDLFLLREMERQSARICGNNGDPDISKLMIRADGTTYLRRI